MSAPVGPDAEGRLPSVGPDPAAAGPGASRLVGTLAFAGAVAGLVIVLVHGWAQPRIEAHQARVLRAAIVEVLGGPDRVETAFLVDGDFTVRPPEAADTASLERVYVGYDATGAPLGVAIAGARPGFQDVIRLLFGYDPTSGQVIGMTVLESKETPGLGDKIEKDSSFVAGFRGVQTPLVGVRAGTAERPGSEVDLITGATISARTIVELINARLAEVGGSVDRSWRRGFGALAPGGS